jgi:hypothetical protein
MTNVGECSATVPIKKIISQPAGSQIPYGTHFKLQPLTHSHGSDVRIDVTITSLRYGLCTDSSVPMETNGNKWQDGHRDLARWA